MISTVIRYYILVIMICGFSDLKAQNTEVFFLSGTGAEDTKTWQFYCSDGRKSKSWTTIEVPSCWEQQGFGAYNYGHVPFDQRLKETGLYRYNFEVPEHWKEKHIDMVFEGVMTDALVKINGKQAGEVHQGAFYPFRYNISSLLNFDQSNEVEVLVKKFSDNLSVNHAERKADYWIFGGIFRPVYLEAKPITHIKHLAIDAGMDGHFRSKVTLENFSAGDKITVQLRELSSSNIVGRYEKEISHLETEVEFKIENPKLWNPESPQLYIAEFQLKRGNSTLHREEERFGFRTVEIRESDGIYVNGVKVKLKGVNRHTFHPKYGRTSSKAFSIEAVEIMKDMNMNAVRMSHYPPDRHFLDVCDSLGLFVLDELAGWQTPAYDDEVGSKLLKAMIQRDVNHPCIIIWDNGNEGGWNTDLDTLFEVYDIQKRIVIHPWEDFQKTNTIHYQQYDYLSLDGYSKRKIFFPTEVLHGLYDGGHGAGLEDYWMQIWHHPLAAGAFLWVFADEGIERTDRNNEIDTDGNHAPDGILGPYMEKEGSFYTIKRVWSPVYFEKKYINDHFDGKFKVENRYHFTNLNQCEFHVQWVSIDPKTLSEKSSELKTYVKELEPGHSGALQIELPKNWQSATFVKIAAHDAHDQHIETWTFPVQTAQTFNSLAIEIEEAGHLKSTLTEKVFQIDANNKSFTFSASSGQLKEILKDGKVIPLSDGPVFTGQNKKVKEVTLDHTDSEKIVIRSIIEAPFEFFQWTIDKAGNLDLEVYYQPESSSLFAGINFNLDENAISSMRWLGQGPYRVWKNRMSGTNFGVWSKLYNDTQTGYGQLEYPEFKGYHAQLYAADILLKDNDQFRVRAYSDDIFLRMLTPKHPEDSRHTKVEYPSGDLSFLHGIPAIGTKFNPAEKLGPQSSAYKFNPSRYASRNLQMKLRFEF